MVSAVIKSRPCILHSARHLIAARACALRFSWRDWKLEPLSSCARFPGSEPGRLLLSTRCVVCSSNARYKDAQEKAARTGAAVLLKYDFPSVFGVVSASDLEKRPVFLRFSLYNAFPVPYHRVDQKGSETFRPYNV